jgi:hypothetical protein
MRFTTHRALRPAAPAPGAALVSRSRRLSALIAAALALGLWGQLPADAAAAAGGGLPADLRVGHAVKQIDVEGSALGEKRAGDVQLWYPADHQGLADLPKSVYSSALHRESLPAVCGSPPVACDPLSWTVEAEIAREGAAIDPNGQSFPAIVFSHGSVNDPIDYAHTLELIAGAGFVVAAPSHVNNTQDDVRIDFINSQAGVQWFACRDGRPRPAPGQTSRSAWRTGSGTSRRSWTSSPSGSETGSTQLGRASLDTRGEPRRHSPRRAAARHGAPKRTANRADLPVALLGFGLPSSRNRSPRGRAASEGDHGHGHRC